MKTLWDTIAEKKTLREKIEYLVFWHTGGDELKSMSESCYDEIWCGMLQKILDGHKEEND